MPPEKKTNQNSDDFLPEFINVTDVLDLHGFFPEQLPEMLEDFVQNALALNLTQLRIIHGKGKSKLKWTVRKFLESHPQVLQFHDAPPELGGWGATVVELAPRTKP
jgi:DNA mismatch repair protein MutS2